MDGPILQVALDHINLPRALKAAEKAVKGGADWIEAGTPLIKAEGLNAVRRLRLLAPKKTVIADMKIMDAGRVEVEAAAKAGARYVTVLAAATDATIRECVEAGRNYGAGIIADLIGIENPLSRARRLADLGVSILGVHCAIDEQMEGKDPFQALKKIRQVVRIPIAVAGGIHSENAALAVRAGATIVVVGGAITKAKDPGLAARTIRKAITKKIRIHSDQFKRVRTKDIRKALGRASSSNVSDALHRTGTIEGLLPLARPTVMVGRVVTVRTYPGDWAKTVQAIDVAEPGDVIVIDAGGVGPAVWGELATHGAIQRKLGGVIVHGAVRDSREIRKLGFPVFTRLIMPNAGEPKGLGEIGVPITIGGVTIFPGDWAVGDDDGVCVISGGKVVEIANRALHVLETENRIRKEIEEGSTLGKVIDLIKWEKRT